MSRVLITGGSRGLGLAVCRKLLADGCQVVVASRRPGTELTALQEAHPSRLEHVAVDFNEPGSVAEFGAAARLLDGLDGFIANAGVGTEGLLTLMSDAQIDECLQVNLRSVIQLSREVVKGMLARNQGGSLVFISSVAARTGLAGLSVYSAAKGALLSFSKALAREYGEVGIRCNCVLPGFISTDMSASLSDENRARLTRRTSLKRLAIPADIVGAITFLLSDTARYVTGSEVVVDGGLL